MQDTVLFLPVSGPQGSGEYYRCLTLAESLKKQSPEVNIEFALHKGASYTKTCPFKTHELSASPTKSVAELEPLITGKKYRLVVFDCAGRTALLKTAKKSGAAVIYISSRPRARQKGLRLRWQALIDQHWSVQPKYIVANMTRAERLKRRLVGGPVIEHIGTIYSQPIAAENEHDWLETHWPAPARVKRVLISFGGGGYLDNAQEFAEQMIDELNLRFDKTALSVRFVLGQNFEQSQALSSGMVKVEKALSPSAFLQSMNAADFVITNGGSSLSQAVELGKPVICCAIAPDQVKRVEKTAALKLAMKSTLNAELLVSDLQKLMSGKADCRPLPRSEEMAVDIAVKKIQSILEER